MSIMEIFIKVRNSPVSGLKSLLLFLQRWEIHVFIIMIYSIFNGLVMFKSAAYLKKTHAYLTLEKYFRLQNKANTFNAVHSAEAPFRGRNP